MQDIAVRGRKREITMRLLQQSDVSRRIAVYNAYSEAEKAVRSFKVASHLL